MNKKQFIEKIAELSQLTSKQADAALNATFASLKDVMANDDTIAIPDFGSFGSKVRAARKGRNPSTGEEIQIAEATVPYFKAGSQLKAALNQKVFAEQEN